MRLLGNIIWFILGGWWNFLVYALLGVLFCITIIGIPVGKSLFQYAKLMALPFGKVIMKETEIKGKENVSVIRRVGGVIANILWLPFGIATFIANVGVMLVCFITIILIPVGIVLAKSCVFLLWPVGAKVVTKTEAEAIRMRNAMRMMPQAPVGVAVPSDGASAADAVVATAGLAATAERAILQQEQTAVQVQPNRTLENLKAGGVQVLGKLKETGSKVATSIAETSEAGMTAVKNRQNTATAQALAKAREFSVEELLIQLETKMYHNKIMAWIMPFLEYITLGVGLVSVILGMIKYGRYGGSFLVLGVFYGILYVASLMGIASVLGMVKRNHIFVLSVMGTQLVSHLIVGFAARSFSLLPILCYIGVIVWYVLNCLRKDEFAAKQAVGKSREVSVNTVDAMESNVQSIAKSFCSQCGAEYSVGSSFCPKCGNKLK